MSDHNIFDIVVAIPAKNEESRIAACLQHLSRQTYLRRFGVVVLANNCTDRTVEISRGCQTRQMSVNVIEVELPHAIANAGQARRLAMDGAAQWVKPDGILLTTDADAIADPTWLSHMRREFNAGNDAVAGAVSANWEELSKFPADVLEIGAREWEYQKLCAELEALADPEIHDPWPRHNQNCGANAGITAAAYRAIGGLPALAVGEDRAMFDAVRMRDGKVRHAPEPHVTASARTIGRASGGMADALRTRHQDTYLCDDLLEPAETLLLRARLRHAGRMASTQGKLANWLESMGLARLHRDDAPHIPFGAVWHLVEQAHPKLQKQRLSPADLDIQIGLALQHLTHLRPVSEDSPAKKFGSYL